MYLGEDSKTYEDNGTRRLKALPEQNTYFGILASTELKAFQQDANGTIWMQGNTNNSQVSAFANDKLVKNIMPECTVFFPNVALDG